MSKNKRFITVKIVNYIFIKWHSNILNGQYAVVHITADKYFSLRSITPNFFYSTFGYFLPRFIIALFNPVSREEFLAESERFDNILSFEWAVPEDRFNKDYFENLFSEAVETAEERDVMIYCGEYGVIELADPESAVNWYRDIHNVFEKYGIGRAIWCYKGKDFGISDGRLSIVQNDIIENS